jgi:hypothetical protein
MSEDWNLYCKTHDGMRRWEGMKGMIGQTRPREKATTEYTECGIHKIIACTLWHSIGKIAMKVVLI